MNKKVRLARLFELKFILDNHDKLFKEVDFDMTVWFDGKNACKSAACALGSAGLYPKFRRAGLKTTIEGDVFYKNSKEGFLAGAEFFGITYEESEDLFDPYAYERCVRYDGIKPTDVSKKVAELIRKYEK